VDLSRSVHPLNAVLRVAFALVIVVALTIDLWVLDSAASRLSVVCVVLIAALGVGWMFWPKATPIVAIIASSLSLLATSEAAQAGLRFALFTEFVALPVLFAAALSSVARWRWPISLALAVSAEMISLRAEAGPVRWVVAVSMLVLLGAAVTAVVYMRLRDQERRSSVELARQNERYELARELHDVVGHHVTGIVVLAQASLFTKAGKIDQRFDAYAQTLAEIEAAGLATLTSVRRLVGLLRSDPSTSSGATFADVERCVDDLRRTHPGTNLVVDSTTRAEWVPPDLEATVLRLVQEGATNVRKHGDPEQPVLVDVRRTATSVVLSMDNGRVGGAAGFGYGLIGMRERVEALGGTFDAGPDGDRRWAVRATVPLIAVDRP
jgi:signal transduction histidine kinase